MGKQYRRWLLAAAQLLVVLAVAWFVRRTLVEALASLRGYRWNLQPGWLVLAGVFCLLGYLPAGLFWHRLLLSFGQDPPLGATLRAYYIGQLGKYVPGKVVVILIRAGLLRRQRVDVMVAALTIFVETMTMMAVGGFLAAAILVTLLRADRAWLAIGLAFMLMAGLPTFPPLFRRLVRWVGARRYGNPALLEGVDRLGYRLLLFGWAAMTVGWVFTGLSLWAVLRAMEVPGLAPLAHLPIYTAGVAMSKVAGFVSLIPAGLGVTDLTLTQLMATYLGWAAPAVKPELAALVAAVVLRLVWLLSELVASVILYVLPARWTAPPSA